MNIFWARGVSGDFATASNWNPAVVPGAADDVTIGVKGTYNVISSANETIDSLTITDKHATLLVTGSSSFSTSSGVNDGTIITDSGSSLTVTSNSGLLGSFANSGTLEATNASSLTFFEATITNTPHGLIEANGAN
jgi:hypothetical protein